MGSVGHVVCWWALESVPLGSIVSNTKHNRQRLPETHRGENVQKDSIDSELQKPGQLRRTGPSLV